MLKRKAGTTAVAAVFLTLCGAPLPCIAHPMGLSPMQAASEAPTRVLGTVTSVGNDSLTVKPANGAAVTVTVGASTRILSLQPGQKSLADATPIQLTGIAAGDRALVSASSNGGTLTANLIVAMKASAIAARQQAEEQDWQQNGVGGIVKSVDPANNTIVLASGTEKITILTSSSTRVREYASNSVAFKDTRPSVLGDIKPGDQLRAKGAHSADNHTVTANAIVFGSFQNIAGLVLSVDASANTLTVKNLATKKPVTLAVDSNSTLRQLPKDVAEKVAMRLHAIKEADHKTGAEAGKEAHPEHNWHARQGAEKMGPGQSEGNAFNRVLTSATPIQLSNLHKGDAVMIVASEPSNNQPGTALTLLSGVAPMLRASRKASQSMFSSSWSLGGGQGSGGSGGSGGGQQGDSGSQKK